MQYKYTMAIFQCFQPSGRALNYSENDDFGNSYTLQADYSCINRINIHTPPGCPAGAGKVREPGTHRGLYTSPAARGDAPE